MSEEQDRHSKALDAELITGADEKTRVEARNGIRQFDAVIELIEYFLLPDRKVKLRPSHLLQLHRIALEGFLLTRAIGVLRGSKSAEPGTNLSERTSCQKRLRKCATT